jgi:predicted amidohydrolase
MVELSIVQFTPSRGDKQSNLGRISDLLNNVSADIIVLPELCTTGYSFLSTEEVFAEAEDLNGETIGFFSKIAAQLRAMIIAGFAEKHGAIAYNSALIASPDGSVKVYRKTHLFYREKICFAPGNSGFFVVEHPLVDCRVGVMVCNDWRYPEAARSLALMGADVISCPCNLVSNVWAVGMAARALENKVYVAVANRCGTEKRNLDDGTEQSLAFNGQSVVYDFNGAALVQAGAENDIVLTITIDPLLTRDKSFNAFNHLFNDRRPDTYSLVTQKTGYKS